MNKPQCILQTHNPLRASRDTVTNLCNQTAECSMQSGLQEHGPELQGLSLTQFSAYTYRRITLSNQQTVALTFHDFFSGPYNKWMLL